MDTKLDLFPDTEERIAYVRAVKAEELPDDVRAQVENIERLYAVHDEGGVRLALVNGRRLAFALARQNDYTPVNVH